MPKGQPRIIFMERCAFLQMVLLAGLLWGCATVPPPALTLDDFQDEVLVPLAHQRADQLLSAAQNDVERRFSLHEWGSAMGLRDPQNSNIYLAMVDQLKETGVLGDGALPSALLDPQAQADAETRKAQLQAFSKWLGTQRGPLIQKLRQLFMQSARKYSDPADSIFAVCVAGTFNMYEAVNGKFHDLLHPESPLTHSAASVKSDRKSKKPSCPEEKIAFSSR